MDNLREERRAHGVEPGGIYDQGLKALVTMAKFIFFGMVAVIAIMLGYYILASGWCTVPPQQAAIVLKYGAFKEVRMDGWKWYPPAPIYSFVYIRTSPQTVDVNFLPGSVPNPEAPMEAKPLVPGSDRYLMSGDANIIHTSWTVEYRVTNPKQYYEAIMGPANPLDNDTEQIDPVTGQKQDIRGPQTMLRNLLRSVVLKVTAGKKVEQLLYTNKEYSDQVQSEYFALVRDLDLGIEITNVILKQAVPPTGTRQAFSEVTEANQARSSEMEKAREYQISAINNAEARAQQILSEARSYHVRTVAQVEAESIYFKSIYEQYKNNPESVLTALYNNTLMEVLNKVDDKYIVGDSTNPDKRRQVRLQMNPEPRKSKKTENEVK